MMSKDTTIKVGKATLRLIVKYKALLERMSGKGITMDCAVFSAVVTSDMVLSQELGLIKDTEKDVIKYMCNFLQDIQETGTDDERESLKTLMSDMSALQELRTK